MKRRFTLFRSFGFKVTFILIALMVFSGAVSNFIIFRYALSSQLTQLREKLMIAAQASALSIERDRLMKIPLNHNGVNSPEYKKVREELLKIKKVAPSIIYIYVLAKTDKEGICKFIIDVEPYARKETSSMAYPGDEYDASRFPELQNGFYGPSADKNPVADEWGLFLSGYAPVYNDKGDAVAVLGIDMSAKDVYDIQKEVKMRALFVLALGIILSLLLGTIISGRVTAPVKKLVEGTRHIASGDLLYRVKVGGADEISELADDFNSMASMLYKARRRLLNYFYRVVQSLIRALEAKDKYTKGHSDRVAEYAGRVAAKMGLPADKVQLLKDAALLHDIGKLGIAENIIGKDSPLTDEEWKRVREHPAIGESILRPVSPDKELLAIVRGHHERYDGKGYPDRLKGDDIDILASIVAVADSYDAMVSHRPYRKDMATEEALAQIEKNKGAQFNPKVADAFIDAMR